MQQIIVQIIFGWPFIILSLLLSGAGIIAKRPAFLVAGAVIFTPPAWYLSGYPSIRWFGILLPVLILGAAYSVERGKTGLAWILLAAPLLVSAWLATVVITQSRLPSGI